MSIRKLLILASVASVSAVSACKTSLFNAEVPAAPQPQVQAAPVVVDGMRTSYADVVEKTSPAVVRIEADHKQKPSEQMQFPGGDDFFKQFRVPQQNQRPQIEHGLGSGVVVQADG